MAFLKVKNNASSVLNVALDDSTDPIDVELVDGGGVAFPDEVPFHVSIGTEILECIGINHDVLTCTRGAESTTPVLHNPGDIVKLKVTAAIIQELQDFINSLDVSQIIQPTFTAVDDINRYDVCYIDANGAHVASAVDEATAYPLVMAVADILAGESGFFAVDSIIENLLWTFTPGRMLYLSETLGALSHTPPMNVGCAVVICGYAMTTTKILFRPAVDYITI